MTPLISRRGRTLWQAVAGVCMILATLLLFPSCWKLNQPTVGEEGERFLAHRDGPTSQTFPVVNDCQGHELGTIGPSRDDWNLVLLDGTSLKLYERREKAVFMYLTQSADCSEIRAYWYEPGMFGLRSHVSICDVSSGETSTFRITEDSWVEAVKRAQEKFERHS